MYVLTTNDKTVKLWKIFEREKKVVVPVNKNATNENELNIPKVKSSERQWTPTLKKRFPMLHTYHINSISISANGENFLSSDDLRINLWNLENTNEAFNIIDLKPNELEELSEVITASQFHPSADNQFIFSTSKGVIKMGDLRKNSNCNKTALAFEEKEAGANKNFFTEIVASISDISFSANGQYIYSRDFLNTKIWDVRNNSKPINSIQVYEPLKSKLCDLYENECIFDKFSISTSPCSNYFLTGMFNSNFHISDREGNANYQFELNFNKKTIMKHIPKKHFEQLGTNYDFSKKVLKSTWHPKKNTIAISCLNCLYFYNSPM